MRCSPPRRTLALTLMALGAGMGFATQASAAAPWTAPMSVAGAGPAAIGQPAIASAPDGTTYAIWTRSDGANQRIQIATRAPGGTFASAGPALSPAGQSADSPQIAVDRQGDATAAWRRCTGSVCVVQAAYQPAGGAWQPAVDVSDTSTNASNPNLAVGDHGNAVLTWTRSDGSTPRVEATIRPAGSAFFTNRSFISAASGTGLCPPRAAMDADGDAIVLWQRLYDPDGAGSGVATWIMESNERTAGGSFSVSAARTQSSTTQSTTSAYIGANSCTYDVAMTPSGRALAIWDYNAGGGAAGSQFVEYADRVGSTFAAGSWSPRSRASAPGQNAEVPSAALDDAGNAMATWSAYDGSNWLVQGATRGGLGAWGDRTDLSGPGAGAFQSTIAASPNGDGMIVWPGNAGADPAVFGARSRPGTGFSGIGPAVVGHSSGDPTVLYSAPAVAMDGEGNGFALYTKTVTSGGTPSYSLEAAGMDPVAPAIASVSVPAGATTGQPAGMAAQVADRMGAVNVAWSFGDGGSATGASVTHAYGAPGTYTVTVTASDAAGNQSSQSRTIQVSNPQPPPPVTKPPATRRTMPAKASAKWTVKGAQFTLTKLTIAKLPKGWAVKATCSGKHCPFTAKALKNRKLKSGTLNALKALGKARTFHAGQTLTLRITARGYKTKVIRWTLKAGKVPKAKS